jgi:flavodoxin
MATGKSSAIVYASVHHENTRRIAEAMAEELQADLFTVDQAEVVDFRNYQLVGLGSGIYFGRHHHSLRRFVDTWQRKPERVFLFSTAGLPFLHCLQHLSLRRRALNNRLAVVGEFSCRGWDTVGPLWLMGGINRRHPNPTDVDRAKEFARQLAIRCQLPAPVM